MSTKISTPNPIPYILILALCLPPAAQARLGETISAFRARSAGHYLLKSEKKKDQSTTYYMFSLNVDRIQKQTAPDLAAGVTVTVTNGHISGESMAICVGSGTQPEKLLAVAHCLEFVYEAIGKKPPATNAAKESELSSFYAGAEQALSGAPQCVRYNGFHAKITLSRTSSGDLLVGVSPEKLS